MDPEQQCELKPVNFTFKYLDITIDDKWVSIPSHLILGSMFTFVSLTIYFIIRLVKNRSEPSFPNTAGSTPPFLPLVFGMKDHWLRTKKGKPALHFANFLRMIMFLAVVTLVISAVSLLINYMAGKQTDDDPFTQTLISNLSDNSPYHYFNIIASAILPWLVVMVVRHFMVVRDKIECPSDESSSTLVVEGLDPDVFSDKAICEHFHANYPRFRLVRITRAQDTRFLRRMMLRLEWYKAINKEFLDMGDGTECSCCGDERSLDAFGRKEIETKRIIQQELIRLRKKSDFLRIVFLTFRSNIEAEKIAFREQFDHFSSYNTIKQAPRPTDIAWENMRSPVLSIIIKTFCFAIICLVSIFSSTPATFAKKIVATIDDLFPSFKTVPFLSSHVIPVILFTIFSKTMPYLVKFSSVKFGPWSKIELVRNYMITLFFWLLFSMVVFPTLMLSETLGLLEYLTNFSMITNIFDDSSETDGVDQSEVNPIKLICIYIPTSGAFFVNYLILSTLIFNQMHLHMVGDLLYELWMVFIHCCTRAERRVASAYTREYCVRRNTEENTGLAEDYVHCVLHFAILMCFCLICPLVSLAFLLFIISKYLVDLQNFRHSYSAKEDQPVLIRTAVKLVIFCPLLGQACTTVVHNTNAYQEENSNLALLSAFLLILNTFLLLILQGTGWMFPVSILGDKKNEDPKPVRRDEIYEDPAMQGGLQTGVLMR